MCVSFRFRIQWLVNQLAFPAGNSPAPRQLEDAKRRKGESSWWASESPVVESRIFKSCPATFFFSENRNNPVIVQPGEFTLGSFTYIFSQILVVSHDALQRCFALFTTQVFGQKWCKAAMQQEKRWAMRLHVLFCWEIHQGFTIPKISDFLKRIKCNASIWTWFIR